MATSVAATSVVATSVAATSVVATSVVATSCYGYFFPVTATFWRSNQTSPKLVPFGISH